MRSRMTLFALVFAIGSFVLPFMAHAGVPNFGPIIPSGNSSVCPAGWGMLIIVINNLISFLITIAIVFVAPLMIAYAGFLFVVNPVNSGGISKAKEILTNTIVGIVIALAGYLIVDAVMAVLYNPREVGKTWSEIINWNDPNGPCLSQAGALPGDRLNQAETPGVTVAPGTAATEASIASAANAYRGTSTANGPGNGSVACAWAVNNVLSNAGIAPIDGNSVASMEAALQGGRGTLVDQAAAQPGDIVIQAGDGHVGICMNVGCSQVISNSSSRASFSWISDTSFSPSYSGGPGRIYRPTGG